MSNLAQHMEEIIFQSIDADEEGEEVYIAELQSDDGMHSSSSFKFNQHDLLIPAHRPLRGYAAGTELAFNGRRGAISLGFFQS